MRYLCVLTLTLTMVPIILSADSAGTALYRTDLSPTFQEPPLQGVSAGGLSNIAIHVRRDDDGNMLNAFVDFRVNYFFGQEETVVALHIHEGVVGENGPVVISSGMATPITGRFGNIFLQVMVDDPDDMATVERILAAPEGFYINLHSASNPAGILRGQVRAQFVAQAVDGASREVRAAIAALEMKVDIMVARQRRILAALGILTREEAAEAE